MNAFDTTCIWQSSNKDVAVIEVADDARQFIRAELGVDENYTTYGVHGYAKPMEDRSGDTICKGGADQFNTALPEYALKRIGAKY